MNDRIVKICKRCGKEFETSKFTLNREYCSDCVRILKNERVKNRGYQQAEILKQQRLEERNYKPYICLICGREFIEDYRKDIRAIKKERPRFYCQESAAKYSSRQKNLLNLMMKNDFWVF